MEEECSARPCATDFSIAAIMARDRQERRERRRHRDPREDTLTPLGKKFKMLLLKYNTHNVIIVVGRQNTLKIVQPLYLSLNI